MKKYILMLSLVLVLALVVIGVGYGYWSETLDVNGTVSAGELSMKWDAPVGDATYLCEEKHWAGHWVSEELNGVDYAQSTLTKMNDNLFKLDIVDGYPGYYVRCDVPFRNDGTIPALGNSTIIKLGDNFTASSCTFTQSGGAKEFNCPEMNLFFSDNLGTHFAPGSTLPTEDSFHVEIKGDAAQNTTYTFYMGSCAVQDVGTLPGGADCIYPDPPSSTP